jgi:hypothetical protein
MPFDIIRAAWPEIEFTSRLPVGARLRVGTGDDARVLVGIDPTLPRPAARRPADPQTPPPPVAASTRDPAVVRALERISLSDYDELLNSANNQFRSVAARNVVDRAKKAVGPVDFVSRPVETANLWTFVAAIGGPSVERELTKLLSARTKDPAAIVRLAKSAMMDASKSLLQAQGASTNYELISTLNLLRGAKEALELYEKSPETAKCNGYFVIGTLTVSPLPASAMPLATRLARFGKGVPDGVVATSVPKPDPVVDVITGAGSQSFKTRFKSVGAVDANGVPKKAVNLYDFLAEAVPRSATRSVDMALDDRVDSLRARLEELRYAAPADRMAVARELNLMLAARDAYGRTSGDGKFVTNGFFFARQPASTTTARLQVGEEVKATAKERAKFAALTPARVEEVDQDLNKPRLSPAELCEAFWLSRTRLEKPAPNPPLSIPNCGVVSVFGVDGGPYTVEYTIFQTGDRLYARQRDKDNDSIHEKWLDLGDIVYDGRLLARARAGTLDPRPQVEHRSGWL